MEESAREESSSIESFHERYVRRYINSIFSNIEREGLITFPEVFDEVKKETHDFVKAIIDNSENVDGLNNILKNLNIEEKVTDTFRERLIERNKTKQSYLSERAFWTAKKRLEEGIRKIKLEQDNIKFQTVFGISDNNNTSREIWNKYNFAPLLYLHLGLCGGAFAVIDKSQSNFIIQHDRKLQEITNTEHDFRNIPFVQIPYRYNKDSADKIKKTESFRKTLDAMYISIRQNQRISEKLKYSPEFYHYLPALISKKDRKKLPPFEQNLIKDGFNMVYCTVGEVLLHLYAWRMLVRKTQAEEVIEKSGEIKFKCKKKIGIQKNIKDGPTQFKDFYLTNDFWEEIREARKNNLVENLPELDWLDYLEKLKKYKTDNKSTGQDTKSIEKIINLWESEIKYKIDDRKIVYEKKNEVVESNIFSMPEEYELLGLIKEVDGVQHYTREFLALIRYTLHISKNYLGWKAVDLKSLEGTRKEKNTQKIINDAITSLHTVEKRLEKTFHNEDGDRYEAHQKPVFKEESKRNFEDNIPMGLDECLRRVVKAYLLDGEPKEKLYRLFEQLHKKCRFPIIPYYYELAVGVEHQPKEHLILCNWNSSAKEKFKIFNEEDQEYKTETGVAFSILTINPIWTINPKYRLCEDGKSLHYANHLSKASFTRIFRLHDLFSILARPIVRGVYYGTFFSSDLKKKSFQVELDSFHHELSKVIDNAFNRTHISFDKLFPNNYKLQEAISEAIPKAALDKLDPIDKWGIVCLNDRFRAWEKILSIWTGKREKSILNLEKNPSVHKVILESYQQSKAMYAASVNKAAQIPKDIEELIAYVKDFEQVKNNRYKLKIDTKSKKQLNLLYLYSNEGDEKTREKSILTNNAFIRLLLATIVNIHEHTTGDFHLNVNKTNNSDLLEFSFINPCNNNADLQESVGTKPVLINCLNWLDGNLSMFGYASKYAERYLEIFRIELAHSINLHDSKSQKYWITKYQFDTKKVFKSKL